MFGGEGGEFEFHTGLSFVQGIPFGDWRSWENCSSGGLLESCGIFKDS